MCIQVILGYGTKQVTTSRRSYFRVLLTGSRGAQNGSTEVASCTEGISILQRRVKSRKLISYEKKRFVIYPKSLLNAENSFKKLNYWKIKSPQLPLMIICLRCVYLFEVCLVGGKGGGAGFVFSRNNLHAAFY